MWFKSIFFTGSLAVFIFYFWYLIFDFLMCRGWDSNPHGRNSQLILSQLCKPIPAPRQNFEAAVGIAPTYSSFADCRVSISPRRPIRISFAYNSHPNSYILYFIFLLLSNVSEDKKEIYLFDFNYRVRQRWTKVAKKFISSAFPKFPRFFRLRPFFFLSRMRFLEQASFLISCQFFSAKNKVFDLKVLKLPLPFLEKH